MPLTKVYDVTSGETKMIKWSHTDHHHHHRPQLRLYRFAWAKLIRKSQRASEHGSFHRTPERECEEDS